MSICRQTTLDYLVMLERINITESEAQFKPDASGSSHLVHRLLAGKRDTANQSQNTVTYSYANRLSEVNPVNVRTIVDTQDIEETGWDKSVLDVITTHKGLISQLNVLIQNNTPVAHLKQVTTVSEI